MKFFGQLWFILGLTTCILFGITVACQENTDCDSTNAVCTDDVCVCKPEYTGTACEQDNPCKDGTCSDQGTCEPSDDDTPVAVCKCNAGFIGEKCEIVDPCHTETCSNQGTCKPSDATTSVAVCTCNTGFIGDKCETEGVCYAGGNECANGGTCVTSITPTTCTCADGYTGDTCQNAGGTVRISGFLMTLTVLTFFVLP